MGHCQCLAGTIELEAFRTACHQCCLLNVASLKFQLDSGTAVPAQSLRQRLCSLCVPLAFPITSNIMGRFNSLSSFGPCWYTAVLCLRYCVMQQLILRFLTAACVID
jgi:hypothetical protein